MLFLFVLFPNPYISAAARCLITQANVDWFHESSEIHTLTNSHTPRITLLAVPGSQSVYAAVHPPPADYPPFWKLSVIPEFQRTIIK
jgi:hypothetical protein